jgi:hypothetical protein
LSGYQLASPCGELLTSWLEGLQEVTAFIDFGPRIGIFPTPDGADYGLQADRVA